MFNTCCTVRCKIIKKIIEQENKKNKKIVVYDVFAIETVTHFTKLSYMYVLHILCVCVCVCIYIRMYIYMCVCIHTCHCKYFINVPQYFHSHPPLLFHLPLSPPLRTYHFHCNVRTKTTHQSLVQRQK